MLSLYSSSTVGTFVAVTLLVVVDFLAAAGFAVVFCLGVPRVAPSKAEDPAFKSISIAKYGRFVAAPSADIFVLLIRRSMGLSKDEEKAVVEKCKNRVGWLGAKPPRHCRGTNSM